MLCDDKQAMHSSVFLTRVSLRGGGAGKLSAQLISYPGPKIICCALSEYVRVPIKNRFTLIDKTIKNVTLWPMLLHCRSSGEIVLLCGKPS